MATYSKRVKLQTNVLLEYVFDTNNFKSEDYKVLTNLKEQTKSFLSVNDVNNVDNSLFMIDSTTDKYSNINTDNFNFLKLQNYFTPAISYDTVKLYFSNDFDFYTDYLGFYINIYTHGFNNNTPYSLSNFYYLKSNIDTIKIFDLPVPFYYDEKFWVRSIEFDVPSVNFISQQRIISGTINEPTTNSLNKNLTYGEGLSTNSPIFIDFSFITSTQTVLNIPYYYLGDLYSCSVPQTPEFTELGINVSESTQGDFFEIYATYIGSNENMDEFAYNEEIKGNKIELEYIVNLYEENILSSTQTFQVSKNFTKKILYRPVIQFSNTTAIIDVELRIVSLLDNSYISKFGSLGITNSINKYGLRLTRLNMDYGVVNPSIYNLKVNNVLNISGFTNSTTDIMKVPYPLLVDKYKILINSSASQTNDYISNGLLEILLTSFDNIIQFNIAQDINSNGDVNPYNLAELSPNSTLMLVFKSDSEKLEKEPFYEANNNYSIGKISYKIEEKDYGIIRRISNKGFDNFYLILNAHNSNTQLYSGKYLFYEDVTFINTNTGTTSTTNFSSNSNFNNSGTTSTISTNVVNSSMGNSYLNQSNDALVSDNLSNSNIFNSSNTPLYTEDPNVNKGYWNIIVYVRSESNINLMTDYYISNSLTPVVNYGNVFYFERVYITMIADMESQDFIEKVFKINLGGGLLPTNAAL